MGKYSTVTYKPSSQTITSNTSHIKVKNVYTVINLQFSYSDARSSNLGSHRCGITTKINDEGKKDITNLLHSKNHVECASCT